MKRLTATQAALLDEASRRRPGQSIFPTGARLTCARRLVRAGYLVQVEHPCKETPAFQITSSGKSRLAEHRHQHSLSHVSNPTSSR